MVWSAIGGFKQRVVSGVDVGPFKVSGLDIAVQLLKAVFDEAEEQIPNMLCVRHKWMNANSFSNHSWAPAKAAARAESGRGKSQGRNRAEASVRGRAGENRDASDPSVRPGVKILALIRCGA